MVKEKNNKIKIKYFGVGPLETNCILIADEETKKVCIVDPGDEASVIMAEVADEGWSVDKIVITHGHYDHIGALSELVDETGVQVFIHKNDEPLLHDSTKNFSAFFGLDYKYDGSVTNISQGSRISVGTVSLDVIEVPGHTKGSIALVGDGFIIAGDTLFAGGIGRTDLPGGSSEQLLHSINTRILSLPDSTVVYPGHGPETTVGEEKHENPFLN